MLARRSPSRPQVAPFIVVSLLAAAVAAVLGTLMLTESTPEGRAAVTTVGLLVAAPAAIGFAMIRARTFSGRRRQAWLLLAAAAVIAVLSNLVAAAQDTLADSRSQATVNDLGIAVALMLSIVSLGLFTNVAMRGVALAVIVLDGLILVSAVLLVVSALVVPELLASTRDGDFSVLSQVVIPILDVVLATLALILLRRSRGSDRVALALVASGFIVYTISDLAYAVRGAQGESGLGSPLDLGWIVGYLLIAIAAWWPEGASDEGPVDAVTPADWDTGIVFGAITVAVVTEVVRPGGTDVLSLPSALLIVLVLAAGVRQTVIARDNAHLRRTLEHRVADQTADLRRMTRETQVLLSSVADGIYGVDLGGRVTFLNPSASAMLGYSVAQIAGRTAHDVFHAPDPDGHPFPAASCYVAEAVEDRIVASAEEDVYVRADGLAFPVEITASPIIDEDSQQVEGGVVVFRDVTQRREIDRVKNEFLSVVSHELRTPLTSIRGSLGLLEGGVLGDLPAPAAGMVAKALRSTERLTRMINDILDLERIESGNLALNLGEHDVATLLADAQREMSGLAAARGIQLVRGPSSECVRADHDRMVQALTNLLGNAIKFSGPGSTVTLRARRAINGVDGVEIRVEDQGRGIPADRLETIFERFEQVDSSDQRAHQGSGLGLAICRGIVERHGGRIWLENGPEEVGTAAVLTLPAAGPGPPPD